MQWRAQMSCIASGDSFAQATRNNVAHAHKSIARESARAYAHIHNCVYSGHIGDALCLRPCDWVSLMRDVDQNGSSTRVRALIARRASELTILQQQQLLLIIREQRKDSSEELKSCCSHTICKDNTHASSELLLRQAARWMICANTFSISICTIIILVSQLDLHTTCNVV